MKQVGDNTYRLSTGREFYANKWILGLAPDDDALFGGYDQQVWLIEGRNESQEFTPEERKEIAHYMIERWRAWAGRGRRAGRAR